MSTEDHAGELIETARKQLEEHKAWLAEKIRALPSDVGLAGARELLAQQAGEIRLRVVRADQRAGEPVVSVVYDYPDELHAYLRSPVAPQELRDSIAGGVDVSVDRAASGVTREP